MLTPVAERIAGSVAGIDLLEAIDRPLTQVKHWFTAFWIGAVVDHIHSSKPRGIQQILQFSQFLEPA